MILVPYPRDSCVEDPRSSPTPGHSASQHTGHPRLLRTSACHLGGGWFSDWPPATGNSLATGNSWRDFRSWVVIHVQLRFEKNLYIYRRNGGEHKSHRIIKATKICFWSTPKIHSDFPINQRSDNLQLRTWGLIPPFSEDVWMPAVLLLACCSVQHPNCCLVGAPTNY